MKTEEIAQEAYTRTRAFNLECQKLMPQLADFEWEPWADTFMQDEYRKCVELILQYAELSAPARHSFIIASRISDGWKLGVKRDNKLKTDPFLVPWRDLPAYLKFWLLGKDQVLWSTVEQYRDCGTLYSIPANVYNNKLTVIDGGKA